MEMYASIINFLKAIGFFDIFLPFILVYAVVYGILQRSKVFGDSSSDDRARGLYALVSFAFAGFVIGSINVVRSIQELIPVVSLFLIIVLGFVLIATFTLAKDYNQFMSESKIKKAIGVLSLITFFILILTVFNLWSWISGFFAGAGGAGGEGEDFTPIIGAVVMFLVIGGIIYWVTRPPKSSSESKTSKSEESSPPAYGSY